MRRVSYKSVLAAAASLYLGQANPSVEDAALLNTFINRRAGEYWESYFWPDWTLVERRTFRPEYNGATTYAAGAEVYYPAEETYYQALRATTGNLPTDTAYWMPSESASSANDYDGAATYAVEAQVYYPTTGKYYQCHTASTGHAPTVAAYWGEIIPFVRSIAYEQAGETEISAVKTVWAQDPRVYENPNAIRFDLAADNFIVRGTAVVVWVELRIKVPAWTGDPYSATQTYAAGDQVYYAAGGDFYTALSGTTAGESPVTTAAKWDRIDFPYVLRDCVPQGAFADALRSDQDDRSLVENAEATRLLKIELARIERQQGQTKSLNVRTR